MELRGSSPIGTGYAFRRNFDAASRLASRGSNNGQRSRTILVMAENGHGVRIIVRPTLPTGRSCASLLSPIVASGSGAFDDQLRQASPASGSAVRKFSDKCLLLFLFRAPKGAAKVYSRTDVLGRRTPESNICGLSHARSANRFPKRSRGVSAQPVDFAALWTSVLLPTSPEVVRISRDREWIGSSGGVREYRACRPTGGYRGDSGGRVARQRRQLSGPVAEGEELGSNILCISIVQLG